MVQGCWLMDDGSLGEVYLPTTCQACRGIHLVNPKTGKVLDGGPFKVCVFKNRPGVTG
jgi:hypothetical protein